jgi:hypothetical protein
LSNSEEHTAPVALEPARLRSISQRLQQGFYDEAAASERIAAAVLLELKHLDESSPALPH